MINRMPSQTSRIPEKASDDRYDNEKHRRWFIRCNSARLVLGLGVAVLLGTTISIAYRIRHRTPWYQDDDDTFRPWNWKQLSIIEDLNIDYEEMIQAREKRRRGEKSRKRRSHGGGDDLPECTPSPLENRETYPKYGCAEIEVGMEGQLALRSP